MTVPKHSKMSALRGERYPVLRVHAWPPMDAFLRMGLLRLAPAARATRIRLTHGLPSRLIWPVSNTGEIAIYEPKA